jgi:hypothetical protein
LTALFLRLTSQVGSHLPNLGELLFLAHALPPAIELALDVLVGDPDGQPLLVFGRMSKVSEANPQDAKRP